MIRKVIAIVLCLMICSTSMAMAYNPTTSEDYIPSESIETVQLDGNFLKYVKTNDTNKLKKLMEEAEMRKAEAHNMAEAARACGYSETHPIITLAKREWSVANVLYNKYKEAYESIWYSEYPVATEIWLYLTEELGYNNYVSAGILGNIMAEVGGGTLNIRYDLYNSSRSHYGMCQWSMYYYPETKDLDLQGQLNYLAQTIADQITYAGSNYRPKFNYEQFLLIEDEQEAALAFACCYERCASRHYQVRIQYATIAYNYFVN